MLAKSPKPIAGDELVRRCGVLENKELLSRFSRRKYYPIAPKDLLYLCDFGDGNAARFARAFTRTWNRVPEGDRVRLTQYWKGLDTLPGVLGIQICMEANSKFRRKGLLAVCEASGLELKFYSHVIDLIPERHLPALIA